MKRVWTKEQEQFLQDNIDLMSTKELGMRCEHGVSATWHRIKKLGLKRQNPPLVNTPIIWTTEQEEFLREHIDIMSVRELGVHCGHPGISAVQHRVRKLGLKKTNRIYSNGCRKEWTKAEDQFLRNNVNVMSVKKLGKLCGRPNISTMWSRIRKLGLKKTRIRKYDNFPSTWTAEQDRLLRENVNVMPLRKLGELCGHPKISTVGNRIRRLGLKKDVKSYDFRNKFPKKWTDEQEQFLRDHLSDMTSEELGKHCGNRHRNDITARLRLMGLKQKRFVSASDLERLSSYNALKKKELSKEDVLSVYPQYNIRVACKKLGVCPQTLSKELDRHGIKKRTRSQYCKGKINLGARKRMNQLWRTGYFASKLYPFPAPNKAEDKLLAIIQELDLPFRYVGDWQYQVGTLNPDFVHMSKPVCIDLFGTYWHSDKNKHNKGRASYLDSNVREKEFNENGHELLVVYEKELRDLESLRNKLVEYANA